MDETVQSSTDNVIQHDVLNSSVPELADICYSLISSADEGIDDEGYPSLNSVVYHSTNHVEGDEETLLDDDADVNETEPLLTESALQSDDLSDEFLREVPLNDSENTMPKSPELSPLYDVPDETFSSGWIPSLDVGHSKKDPKPKIPPHNEYPTIPIHEKNSNNKNNKKENIYEEVHSKPFDKFAAEMRTALPTKPFKRTKVANRKSLVDEVLYEVEKVQRQHDQVIQKLNLDVENMIMPSSPLSPDAASKKLTEDLINLCEYSTVFDSIVPSLPARNYTPRSARGNDRKETEVTATSTPVTKRKWIRLPSLSSLREKSHGESSAKFKEIMDEPIYSTCNDTYSQEGLYRDIHWKRSIPYSDDGIYEDIELNLRNQMKGSCTHGEDEESWDSEELEYYEDKSDTESEQSTSGVSMASLREKIRSVRRRMSRNKDVSKPKEFENEKRLSRIFFRKKEYDLEKSKEKSKSSNAPDCTVEESPVRMCMAHRMQPPVLPPPPPGITPDQMKRRHIISTLLHSENSYMASLNRLIQEYKKPLEESNPPILNKMKIQTMFHCVTDILQCHAAFRIALSDCMKRWDKDEAIGDVFVASFSRSLVLDVYSDFINNFSTAMELAKQEAKRKSAFADFLKVKQITSHDRLSFFGLMVKPVQRLPQFILLLQDLLKHTPQGHHDRMSLQLALTQLESMAETLNERKRESEQYSAVKEILQILGSKYTKAADGPQHLLCQGKLLQLQFNQEGKISKSKERKLILLNDLLVCMGAVQKSGNVGGSPRFTLKWAVPVQNVEIQEESSPTLNRLLSSGWSKANINKNEISSDNLQNLYLELADLMHDFEVMSRISALISTLKRPYQGLTVEFIQSLSQNILQTIQDKDEELKWIDNCCLQLLVPLKAKSPKELVVFQTPEPAVTKDWITELRLAQLACDPNNKPAWDIPEQERRSSAKMPLFVRSMSTYTASYPTEVKCGCYYSCSGKPLNSKPQNYLWICSSDGVNSHISIYCLQQISIRNIAVFELKEVRISTMEAVPGTANVANKSQFQSWSVWMGTDSRRILIYSATDPEHRDNLGFASVAAPVLQLKYYLGQVYAALINGTVLIFRRDQDSNWNLRDYQVVVLGSDPVTSLLPFKNSFFCACGKKVWVLDCFSGETVKSYQVKHEHLGNTYLLAQSGIGLWINLRNTATICLYHLETFKHLQDINVTASVSRILSERDQATSPRCIFVTSLLASRGLLWVGTNVGIILTIPLPRLEGVPIVSGRASISYHMLEGPVTTLISLTSQNSYSSSRHQTSLLLENNLPEDQQRTMKGNNQARRHSATLNSSTPRSSGRGYTHSPSNFDLKSKSPVSTLDYDIYGLYGDLFNVQSYMEDSSTGLFEPLHHSEPDIPNTVSTLDRRVRLKAGRPKSLDLTNLLVSVPLSRRSHLERSPTSCSSSSSSSRASSVSINEQATNSSAVHSAPNNVTASDTIPRTVITLIGGRGYRNIQQSRGSFDSPKYPSISSNHAHIMLWELKL